MSHKMAEWEAVGMCPSTQRTDHSAGENDWNQLFWISGTWLDTYNKQGKAWKKEGANQT